jgi:general secretion pathway protein D
MRWWLCLVVLACSLWAEEGKPLGAPPETIALWNASFSKLKKELAEKFQAAQTVLEKNASTQESALLLKEIQDLRGQISALQEKWRAQTVQELEGADSHALWDTGETTVAQLIMEFGASEYLYVIPPEISQLKLTLFTSMSMPRETWNELIEAVLIHNGIGIRQATPLVKQLYILKLDPSAVEGIVDREEKLALFASHSRLCFVLSPPVEQLKGIQSFFERFSDPKQTIVQSMGTKIVLVSTQETMKKLLGLYHSIWESKRGKVIRLAPLTKIQPAEGEKILKAIFSDSNVKPRSAFYPIGPDELVCLTLPQGLVLVGESPSVERGLQVLQDLECQLEDPGEKVIYWYNCKHSNPADIAEVLAKVYDSLIGAQLERKPESPAPAVPPPPPPVPPQEPNPAQIFPFPPSNTAFNPVLPANPPFVQAGTIDKKETIDFGNFIVDTKTTSILMVVRREDLPKIKSLLKKMDVPKRMVQLDVLLVEKKLQDRKQVGINLLQFGTNSSGKKETAVSFDTNERALNKGILSFIYSKPKGDFPAVDLTYNFLMAQDDIRINANPSVLTINQTPATVSIVEEMSINNGAIQLNTTSGVTVEQSYTRAQYGITIVLTPTIHFAEPDEEGKNATGFVSLQTNLEFDTTQISINDRPPVTRRHIENEVYVADGETVVLGGLRRKIEEDRREKIPFLGDLPGIGKLFGAAKATDTSTEMFIFITPKIIRDPVDDLQQVRQAEYRKRAGDIPEFLACIDEAKAKERNRLFQSSIKTLFDFY